jgi:hypothetical protein
MTNQEFAAWNSVTAGSAGLWTEDAIYRLNGRGAFYYIGGEDGAYLRISKEGVLEAGKYEGAIPHIGEAFFTPAVTRRYGNFSDAFAAAMELGGKKFLVDMFRGADHDAVLEAARRAYEADETDGAERPSVMKQIREAKTAPKAPRKAKSLGKHRDGEEL